MEKFLIMKSVGECDPLLDQGQVSLERQGEELIEKGGGFLSIVVQFLLGFVGVFTESGDAALVGGLKPHVAMVVEGRQSCIHGFYPGKLACESPVAGFEKEFALVVQVLNHFPKLCGLLQEVCEFARWRDLVFLVPEMGGISEVSEGLERKDLICADSGIFSNLELFDDSSWFFVQKAGELAHHTVFFGEHFAEKFSLIQSG